MSFPEIHFYIASLSVPLSGFTSIDQHIHSRKPLNPIVKESVPLPLAGYKAVLSMANSIHNISASSICSHQTELYTHFLPGMHFVRGLQKFSTLWVNSQHKWKSLSQCVGHIAFEIATEGHQFFKWTWHRVFHKLKHSWCCTDLSREVIIRDLGMFLNAGIYLTWLDFVSKEFRQFLLLQPNKSFYQHILFPWLLIPQQPSSPFSITWQKNNWQIKRNHWL